MKITAARLSKFLEQPDPRIGCVLVFGPDRGLVAERAETLMRATVDDPDDPFSVTPLDGATVKADPPRLADEAATMSFGGGRRVVRIADATDALTAAFKNYLAILSAGEGSTANALVIAEGGELAARSSLRRLFEAEKTAAAIACYGDEGRGLEDFIARTLADHGVSASPDALALLAQSLGADRLITRSELEKLVLFKGGSGEIGFDDVRASIGDSAAITLDAVIHAAAGGDHAALQTSLDRALVEGTAPITVLRAVAGHFRRLHLAIGRMAGGDTPEKAMASLKPPVIFKFQGAFRTQLRGWPEYRLSAAMSMLSEAELDCKTTGMPAEAVCKRVLMRIAQAARRPRGRTPSGR